MALNKLRGEMVDTAVASVAAFLLALGLDTKVARSDISQSLSVTQKTQLRNNSSAASIAAMAYNNLIINGDHRISQRFVDAAYTTSGYVTDRWTNSFAGTMTVSAQRVTDSPPGYTHSLKTTITGVESALAAGSFLFHSQIIEGINIAQLAWGTANAQSLSIGWWVKASVTGTYHISVRNGTSARSYVVAAALTANTWTWVSFTVPGDTSGTWATDNTAGLTIAVCAAAGSTYTNASANTWLAGNYFAVTGQTNLAATNGASFQSTGLIALPGGDLPDSNNAYRCRRSLAEELYRCQRYYYKTLPQSIAPADNAGQSGAHACVTVPTTGYYQAYLRFPTEMRSVPAITFFSPQGGTAGYWRNTGNTTSNQPANNQASALGSMIALGNGGQLTTPATDVYLIHVAANSEL